MRTPHQAGAVCDPAWAVRTGLNLAGEHLADMREASGGKAAGGRLDHQLAFQNPKAERCGFGDR
jgi:hypothetical protein